MKCAEVHGRVEAHGTDRARSNWFGVVPSLIPRPLATDKVAWTSVTAVADGSNLNYMICCRSQNKQKFGRIGTAQA